MRLDESWAGVSVSSGTLREQDLISAFEAVLGEAGVTYERPDSVNKLMGGGELTIDEWEEESAYLNEGLFDALNDIAPAGTCFGSHPGDGTDFGFWRASDEEL